VDLDHVKKQLEFEQNLSNSSQSDESMSEDAHETQLKQTEYPEDEAIIQGNITSGGERREEDPEVYFESETSEVEDQTYEPTLPFANELSEDEDSE